MIKINENLEFDITLNDTEAISEMKNIDNDFAVLDKAISNLEKQLQVLSKQSQLTFSNINKGISTVIKSYTKLGQSISKVPTVLTKSISNIQSSTNKVNNSIQKSQSAFNKYLSSITKGIMTLLSDIQSIGEFISYSKEFVKFVANLASGFKNVDKAASGTKNSFSILKRSVSALKKGFLDLDESSNNSNKSLNNVEEQSKKTGKEIDNLSESNNKSTNSSNEFSNATENTSKNVEELGKNADETASKAENFGSSSQKAGEGVSELRDNVDDTTKASGYFETAIEDVGDKMEDTENASSILGRGISTVKGIFGGFFAILGDGDPFIGFIGFIMLLVSAFVLLYDHCAAVRRAINELVNFIVRVKNTIVNFFKGISFVANPIKVHHVIHNSFYKHRLEGFSELYNSFTPQQLVNHTVYIRSLESNFSQSFNIEKIIDIAANKISKAIDKSNEVRYIQTQINVNDKEIANLTQKPLNNMNGQNNILENRLRGIM